jgi:hypothetical protein
VRHIHAQTKHSHVKPNMVLQRHRGLVVKPVHVAAVPAHANLVFLRADELSFNANLDPVPEPIIT